MMKNRKWYQCEFCFKHDLTEDEITSVKVRGFYWNACADCKYECNWCGRRVGEVINVESDRICQDCFLEQLTEVK